MKKLIIFTVNTLLFSFLNISAAPSKPPINASHRMDTNKTTEIDWCETYTDSSRLSKEQSKPLLILFTGTSWCPACIKLEKEILQKPEFIQGVADNFIFYKAEFNDPSPEGLNSTPDSVLLDRYQITAFPTMVIVNEDGKQLFTINYKPNTPDSYVREINQKLQSSR